MAASMVHSSQAAVRDDHHHHPYDSTGEAVYEDVPLCDVQLRFDHAASEDSSSSPSLDGIVLLYPCPCGDTFELALAAFSSGEDVARCPTCSLACRIIVGSASEREQFVQSAIVRARTRLQ